MGRKVKRPLEAILTVHELPERTAVIRYQLSSGQLPDGSIYNVSATVQRDAIIVERQGKPMRVVYLQDLVPAMLAADDIPIC